MAIQNAEELGNELSDNEGDLIEQAARLVKLCAKLSKAAIL